MNQDNPSLVTVDFNHNMSSSEQILAFYPRVTASGFDYSTGFVLTQEGIDIGVHGVAANASTGLLSGFGDTFPTIPNQDPLYPSWLAWPTKDVPGSNAWLSLLTFDSLEPDLNNQAMQFIVRREVPRCSRPGLKAS